MTIFYYDQRNLILIVTRHVRYLNSEHHVAQGLRDFSPQSAEWNASVMSAQVLDRAHIQTPFSYELRCH